MNAPYRVLVTGSRDDRRPRRVFAALAALAAVAAGREHRREGS